MTLIAMKKKLFFPVLSVFLASALSISVKKNAVAEQPPLRVFDYTYGCVGTGGNCLPTVIVTPPPGGGCWIDISFGTWPGGIWVPCPDVE